MTAAARSAPPEAGVEPVLEVIDLRAGYGRIEVVHGVSISLHPGEVLALLGPNGAGKTTTLGVAGGRLPLMSGHLHIAGRHVNGIDMEDVARAGVCTIPEGRGVFPNLTVEENLTVFSYAGVAAADIRERALDRFPRLAERRRQLAGSLSGGEQQMLALARGLTTDPAVLLIDELSMGLAPKIVEELFDEVRRAADDGAAILVVEQFANVALGVADRAAVMVAGTLVYDGATDEAEALLQSAYLGT